MSVPNASKGTIRVQKDPNRPIMANPERLIPSGISHSFDTGVAAKCGVEAAIIYNHIAYWIRHNQIHHQNEVDGRFWTYNSYETMTQYMTYFTARQIKYAIEKLIEAGLIVKDCLSKNKFDRKNWYALADEEILHADKSVVIDETNLSDEIGQKCPTEKTDSSVVYDTGINQLEKQQQQEKTSAAAAFFEPNPFSAHEFSFLIHEYSLEDLEYASAFYKAKLEANPDFKPDKGWLPLLRAAIASKWALPIKPQKAPEPPKVDIAANKEAAEKIYTDTSQYHTKDERLTMYADSIEYMHKPKKICYRLYFASPDFDEEFKLLAVKISHWTNKNT